MKCRILIGDLNSSSIEDLSSDKLADNLEDNGVFEYEFEVPPNTPNEFIVAMGYKKAFFKDWSAQDTCSVVQVLGADGEWKDVDA